MLQKLRCSNEKGFTLIEILTVIGIIGILACITIPQFLAYRTKGQDCAAQCAGKNFYNTAITYFADTTSSDTTVTSAGAPSYIADPNIVVTGTGIAETGGVITVNVQFRHKKSTVTYTLDSSGGLTQS